MWVRYLRPHDRILVLGAGGWFGQTLLNELPRGVSQLGIASTAREQLREFDAALIQDFAPTVVINFAFLTRERLDKEGLDQFTAINSKLTQQFVQSAELESVRAALTISSGAAITEPELPYGALKFAEELAAIGLEQEGRSVVVGRAYSLSGPYVRRPKDYAFSDLILQAHSGRVLIKSDRPTFRRYIAVSDFLAVCLTAALNGDSGVIESGGNLIEIRELAEIIVKRVRPDATIERVKLTSTAESIYASDNLSWMEATKKHGLEPLTLEEQVDATAIGLLSSQS